MKLSLLTLFTALSIAASAGNGYELFFCTGLDSNGNCKNKGEEFNWGNGENTSLIAILENHNKLNTSKVKFKVYNMKNDHDGELFAELNTYAKPYWTAALKKIYFVKPGRYMVEAYSVNETLLATQYVVITDRTDKEDKLPEELNKLTFAH